MSGNFDTIVVGKGLMGSAAARHLAISGVRTALIGPDEPTDKSSHTGVFSSHYDQGRITRRLDTNADWSRLAVRSMARYDEIARTGSVPFFTKCGALLAGPKSYTDRVIEASKTNGVSFESLNQGDMTLKFPYFRFPENTQGTFETSAGYINPRALVKAQTNATQIAGGTIIRQQVHAVHETVRGVTVTLVDGREFSANNVIIAAGAFTNQLLPAPIDYRIAARTVTLFELASDEIQRLKFMPSSIHMPNDDGPYLLPPIQYPDGKTYLKIGGDPIDHFLTTPSELTQWFQGNGNPKGREFLIKIAKSLLPDLRYTNIVTSPCVTTLTPSSMPVIQHQSKHVILLTGGNGAGAKSSDEIGRLAACLAQGGNLNDEGYHSDFTAK